MKSKHLLWGILLIIVGLLIILRNTGLICFHWSWFFNLWPLILIFWGIAILPVKDFIKIILVVLTIGVAFLFVQKYDEPNDIFKFRWFDKEFQDKWDRDDSWNDDDDHSGENTEAQRLNILFDSSTREATLKFEAAAGSFKMKDTTSYLIDFKKEGRLGNYILTASDTTGNRVIKLRFKNKHVRGSTKENNAEIKLNTIPVWDFDFDIGAAEVKFDLSPYITRKVTIDAGAASLNLKLGDKSERTDVNIDSGAAGIKIEVPRSAGVEVIIDSFLTGKELIGFNKIERGKYRTDNFASADKKIFINIDTAVSGLEIDRY
ncbi:MAG: hypothetical protein FJY10_00260 [Bacteroidetes bacterium]|nr:hypothetical protein [Bacteroidota bacterium]